MRATFVSGALTFLISGLFSSLCGCLSIEKIPFGEFGISDVHSNHNFACEFDVLIDASF